MTARRNASLLACAAIAAGASVGLVMHGLSGAKEVLSHPSAVSATRAPATSQPTTALSPLTIAAMRGRAYPASVLTPVRSDGDQGGYANEVVSFVSDGLTEYALMSTPDSARPARGWPVIVLCHGYIDPRSYRTDDASYQQFIAAFARAGYLVLKPDYRGHGSSQGVPEGGYLSPVYTYDILNLISALRADPRVDGTRVGLFGHSLGGYEALRAMVAGRGIVAVALMAGVVGSLDDIFFHWPRPAQPTAPPPPVQQQVARSVITAHGTPQTRPGFWNSASPINFVGDATAAVQIDMDAGDSVVPRVFSDHLAAALHAAGRSLEYITYPGDDHQFIRNRAAVLAHLIAFFRARL